MKEFFIQTTNDEWIWERKSELKALKDLIIYLENRPGEHLIQFYNTKLKTAHWKEGKDGV